MTISTESVHSRLNGKTCTKIIGVSVSFSSAPLIVKILLNEIQNKYLSSFQNMDDGPMKMIR